METWRRRANWDDESRGRLAMSLSISDDAATMLFSLPRPSGRIQSVSLSPQAGAVEPEWSSRVLRSGKMSTTTSWLCCPASLSLSSSSCVFEVGRCQESVCLAPTNHLRIQAKCNSWFGIWTRIGFQNNILSMAHSEYKFGPLCTDTRRRGIQQPPTMCARGHIAGERPRTRPSVILSNSVSGIDRWKPKRWRRRRTRVGSP